MSEHADATELALFARGELDPSRRASFEAHVARCDACAALLAREARLELALVELGRALAVEPAEYREREEHRESEAGRQDEARGQREARRGDRGTPARRMARRMVSVAAIAVACVTVLVVLRRGSAPPREGSRSIPGVVCAEGPQQADCVQKAHHRGLFVQYPTWAGPPPLGGTAVERPGAHITPGSHGPGPSSPPFTISQREI